jgi:hypothetical protein
VLIDYGKRNQVQNMLLICKDPEGVGSEEGISLLYQSTHINLANLLWRMEPRYRRKRHAQRN